MRKLALSLAILTSLGLSGCDSESIEDVKNDVEQNGPVVETVKARVLFDPSNGVVSVPNDLLFSGTTDGTLNLPVADPTDVSDPFVALSALDGWSTTNPWVMDFDFPEGLSLDGSTVFSTRGLRIFEAKMGGDPGCEDVTRGLACQIVGELTYSEDFVTQKSGNSILVAPMKPLKAKTSYILVMTDHLADSNGNSIEPSVTYGLVRQDINTHPLATPDQLQLQGLVNSFEAAVVSAGVEKDSIIYTAAITTQSTTDSLFALKGIMAQQMAALSAGDTTAISPIYVQDTGLTAADALAGRIPAELVGLYSAAKLYGGQVELPYYLGVQDTSSMEAAQATALNSVTVPWKAKCDSGAMLAAASAAGAVPADPVSQNDAECMAFGLRDIGIDAERNITKFNPIPAKTADMNVEVLMTIPDVATANAVRGALGIPGAIAKPDSGWPIVILQHGITSRKEDMLALTGMLSINGIASIAIDQPMHGSRGFDVNFDGTDDINASTVTPIHYMNLAALLNTRDNLRQSAIDLLGLRARLAYMIDAGALAPFGEIDATNVHSLGISLGAMTAINFGAIANTSLASVVGEETAAMIDPVFELKTNVLSAPGGMPANFLIESAAFGPIVKSQLTFAQSADFQNFVASVHDMAGGAPSDAQLAQYFDLFLSALTPEQIGAIESVFLQFAFAAQTVTDSGDPVNHLQLHAASGIPTLLQQINGDTVIPNTVSTAPFGGTEGAIALLGLPNITELTQSAEGPVSGAIRIDNGSHGSLADPTANAALTQDMQMQAIGYILSNGRMISVSDTMFAN
ncbi:VolA/Pla-1 family phospholipase [Thalassotalea agarivorans]|uniref:Extracellular lipase, Pla-1/cef family n=1 Tax=Thalassotalea agarivorans TaxID=349064 RepID=A0A1I0DIC9_THASX|nr:VolA/Pla-1 family phospholipase [Thalassotalea agarivorans]SET31530.1 extracellular lipase, Pla-1/cef family [Thalassotalea agarivorans]